MHAAFISSVSDTFSSINTIGRNANTCSGLHPDEPNRVFGSLSRSKSRLSTSTQGAMPSGTSLPTDETTLNSISLRWTSKSESCALVEIVTTAPSNRILRSNIVKNLIVRLPLTEAAPPTRNPPWPTQNSKQSCLCWSARSDMHRPAAMIPPHRDLRMLPLDAGQQFHPQLERSDRFRPAEAL